MNKVNYAVSGLGNEVDKTKMKNALEKLDGVSQTSVDLARGTVKVGYKKPANEDDIKICIESTGYRIIQ